MRRMAAVQKMVPLQISCAYRTDSKPVMVGARVIAVILLAEEIKLIQIFKNGEGGGNGVCNNALTGALDDGNWRQMDCITDWTTRRYGKINYYLTRLVTGHRKTGSSACQYGEPKEDDTKYIFFEC